MSEVALILEQTTLAQALLGSVWWYPLVNAAHLLGVALLVGGIVPLDLRLLGLWQGVPVPPLWQVLRMTASVGLALALVTGGLLFLARASDYLASAWFRTKLALVLLGLINIAWVVVRYPRIARGESVPPGLRVCAAASLGGWLAVLVLGRLVGYF